MTNSEPGDLKAVTEIVSHARLYGVGLGAPGGSALLEFDSNQSMGQLRRVNRHVQVGQNEGQGAYMIFMAVGYEDGADSLSIGPQVGGIWDNQVYPQHLFGWKLYPTVDNYDVVAALQGHHVLPDFPQSAQGYDPQTSIQFSDLPLRYRDSVG